MGGLDTQKRYSTTFLKECYPIEIPSGNVSNFGARGIYWNTASSSEKHWTGSPASFILRLDIEPVAYAFQFPVFFNDIVDTSQAIVIFLDRKIAHLPGDGF